MNRTRLMAATAVLVAAAVTVWSQEITNPGFDENLTGWSVASEPEHQWSSVDYRDSGDSGSLFAFKDYALTHLSQATQCVPVDPGMTISFMVRVLVLETGDPADVIIDAGGPLDEVVDVAYREIRSRW